MKKRILSIILSASLTIPMVVPTFGATDKEMFLNSFKATEEILQTEQKIIESKDFSSIILKNLMENVYQNKISLGVNDFHIEDSDIAENVEEAIKKIKISNVQNVDAKENKVFQETAFNLPAVIAETKKDLDFNINLFMSKDKIALNIPQLFEDYYYVDPTKVEKDWNKSAIGVSFPLSDLQLKQFSDFQDVLKTNSFDFEKIENDSKALGENYTEFFNKYLDKGTFYRTEGQMIKAKRGQLLTTKTTFRMNDVNANIMLKDFSEFVKTDKSLYNFYDNIYSSTNALTNMDMAQTIVDAVSEGILDYKFTKELLFSIYTNGDDEILKYELDFNVVDIFDEAQKVNISLDTKGNNFLLNEIDFSAKITDKDNYTYGLKVSSIGNNVPKDGVFDTKMDMFLDVYSDGKLSSSQELMNLDYKWDTNKIENNLSMNISAMQDFNPFDFSVEGNIITDKKNKVLDFNFEKILMSYGSNFIDLNARITFNKTDSTIIQEPKNAIDILKMTDEQLNTEATSITKKIEAYNK